MTIITNAAQSGLNNSSTLAPSTATRVGTDRSFGKSIDCGRQRYEDDG
jgi:hypothetical protein